MDENYKKRKSTLLHTLIVVLIGAGVFLQFVGFVTPGWVVRQERDAVDDFTKVNHGGLWYVVLCDEPTKCEAVSAFNKTVAERFFFSSYMSSEEYAVDIQREQIGCFFALASSLPAFLLVLLIKLNKISAACLKTTILLIGSMILCLGSGVLSMALCALLGEEAVFANEDLVSPVGFPYSLFLFALGGLSLVITFVLLIILVACNVYEHQLEMFNVLKYQVPSTQPMLSGNMSCAETVFTEYNLDNDQSTSQPAMNTASNFSVPTSQPVMPHMPAKQVLTHPNQVPYNQITPEEAPLIPRDQYNPATRQAMLLPYRQTEYEQS